MHFPIQSSHKLHDVNREPNGHDPCRKTTTLHKDLALTKRRNMILKKSDQNNSIRCACVYHASGL